MPFTIERNDLAKVSADAIVVAANEGLQINGGVGLAVARAAGLAEMQAACDALGGCPVGQAVATPAFALAAKNVVHVVGPVWQGGTQGEEAVLRQAYDSALACAVECGAHSIALPLVSAHTFGFPVRLSFVTAVEAIKAFLEDHDDVEVRLVLFGDDAMAVGQAFYGNVAHYIDSNYVEEAYPPRNYPQSAAYEDERPIQGPWFSARKEHAAADAPRGYGAAAAAPARRTSPDSPDTAASAPDFSRRESMPSAKRRPGVLSRISEAVEDVRDLVSELRKPAKDETYAETSVIREELEESEEGEGPEEFFGSFDAADQGCQPPEETEARSSQATACPVCGTRIREGMRFCPGCGRTVSPPAEPPDATAAFAPVMAPSEQADIVFWEASAAPAQRPAGGSLKSWLDQLDAPFSTTLLALIDERGLTDAQVYKRANMSRQLFSKIRSDAGYRPTKKTVLALAVALGLDLGETVDLLQRAGFALSHSNKADVIVEYFIVNGNYDIFEINEALYAFDQPLL